MRILGFVFFLLAAATLGSPASADHMTGRYQGTGNVAGVIIDLTQTGTSLQGVISGNDQGKLQGQTDGGDNAQGTITLDSPNSQPFQFQALWAQQGLSMRLLFPGQPTDVFFALGGGPTPQPPQPAPPQPQPPQPGPQPPGPPPLPGPSDVQYFVAVNGQQVGPLTLNDVVLAIQQKQIGPTDLVWKTGAPAWAPANSYPELQAAFAAPPPPPPPPGGGGEPPALPPEGGGGGDPNTPGGNVPPPSGGNNPPPGGGGGLTPPSG